MLLVEIGFYCGLRGNAFWGPMHRRNWGIVARCIGAKTKDCPPSAQCLNRDQWLSSVSMRKKSWYWCVQVPTRRIGIQHCKAITLGSSSPARSPSGQIGPRFSLCGCYGKRKHRRNEPWPLLSFDYITLGFGMGKLSFKLINLLPNSSRPMLSPLPT